jgi:predicted transcriptional regulator
MPHPLEDAAYLTRSEHRVTTLELLAEEPRDRSALKEATGVSRVTMGRMLGELEDRGWVRRDDHEYRVTDCGRIVAEDLSRLLETTGTAQKLRDVEEFLPVEAFDFDLRRFAEATVYRPKRSDPNAPMRRMASLLSSSDRVRVAAPSVSLVPIRAHRNRLLDAEDHEATVVLTAEAVETARDDDDIGTWLAEMVETGRYQLYEYDGSFPADIVVADETVMITLFDEAGGAGFHSMVESDDETVRSWALSSVDSYRQEAKRLDAGAVAEAT